MHLTSGPWSVAEVESYLAETVVPLRLACVSSRGWPQVVSLWFEYRDGALWCATQRTARVATQLARDERCGFEVAPCEPPYRGVRGQGRAELVAAEGVAVLRRLIRRYLGGDASPLARWLLSRAESEVALRITPLRVASWDYTARMSAREPVS